MDRLHEELKKLKKKVIEMGDLAKDMLKKSVDALKKQDVKLADKVLSKKEEIAEMDEKIEEEALQLIALYHPMAKDMRTVACILKMITYLARIGRYGKDIAVISKELSKESHIAKLVEIPHMADMVCGMINDALRSFETEDISLIKNFKERDDEIDALRWSIFRECVTYMMEDPKKITRCAHYMMVSRYLERCADHTCKMAEKIHYMVTGERIEIK